MKISRKLVQVPVVAFSFLSIIGCSTDSYVGSPYHPGPVVGQAVGTGVGVVAGNAIGLGTGVVQGSVHGVAVALDPSYRTVTQWHDETTADGRVIQVPVNILVDKNGRPVNMLAPAGNSSLPPGKKSSEPASAK